MAPVAPQLEPASEVDFHSRSILIVDDDATISDSLAVALDRQGFQTSTAASGREGLKLARQTRPDLVILDLRLPDVDGFTVCQKLVDDPRTCTIPVILLSAMERPDIIRRSRAAGGQYFVRKPYDPNALLVLIEQALGQHGGPAPF